MQNHLRGKRLTLTKRRINGSEKMYVRTCDGYRDHQPNNRPIQISVTKINIKNRQQIYITARANFGL